MSVFNCGDSSTLIASNTTTATKDLYIDGFLIKLTGQSTYTLSCVNTVDASASAGVNITVVPAPNASISFSEPFSFLAGLLCAIAFVMAAVRKQ